MPLVVADHGTRVRNNARRAGLTRRSVQGHEEEYARRNTRMMESLSSASSSRRPLTRRVSIHDKAVGRLSMAENLVASERKSVMIVEDCGGGGKVVAVDGKPEVQLVETSVSVAERKLVVTRKAHCSASEEVRRTTSERKLPVVTREKACGMTEEASAAVAAADEKFDHGRRWSIPYKTSW